MIKVLILSDPTSAHTIKWVNTLFKKGIDVYLFGLTKYNKSDYPDIPENHFYYASVNSALFKEAEESLSKISYLKNVFTLKKILKEIKPDIVHAHYASSYGMLGALINFHPYIISVWGADIYNFPNYSFIHKAAIKFNLSRAEKILSTSHTMVHEIKKYTSNKIDVTPFGVDTEVFKPLPKCLFRENIIVGTIKTLEKKYGIEYLIKAFALVFNKHKELPLKLLIVGGGTQEENLKHLAKELNIYDKVIFTGIVPYSEVIKYHNEIDIYAALSIEDSESFGVAILESSACEKPVIVSRVSGFNEIVVDGSTGFFVEKFDVHDTANKIEKLLMNEELRKNMGKAGRQRVLSEYGLNKSTEIMINIYKDVVK